MDYIGEHRFALPARLWEGPGAAALVPERLRQLAARRVVVVIDPEVERTAWGQRCADGISSAVEHCRIWSRVVPEVPAEVVPPLTEALMAEPPDIVVAIGGGSTIDLVKAAVASAASGSSVEELIAGAAIRGQFIPIMAIPTTCGTGSETSPFAVVTLPDGRGKRGFTSDELVPREVVLDPIALETLPTVFVAATGVDALAHALESFVSRRSTEITRTSSIGAALTALAALEPACDGDPQARRALLSASACARLLYPRSGLTIAHAIAHPLGARLHLHHGTAVARCLIPAFLLNAERAPAPLARLARLLFMRCRGLDDTAAAAHLVAEIDTLLAKLPLDRSPPRVVLGPADAREIARAALSSSNIPSNPADVDVDALEEVVRQCMH